MNENIDPVQMVNGQKVVSTELLKVISVAIKKLIGKEITQTIEVVGEELGGLQKQIDVLGEAYKKRSIDVYEEMAALKNQLASVASDKTAAVREVVTLRREIASLRGEVDTLRRAHHG